MSRPLTDDIVAVFGDLARSLGVREDAAVEAAELRSLLDTPWSAHRSDQRAASPLSESGAPFEISLQVLESGERVLRYVVDVADRSRDLAGNLVRYLEQARAITAAPESVLRDLFDRHLGGAPSGTPGRMMHGVGLAASGRRRATLYFPTDWMTMRELAERAPHPAEAVSRVHRISGAALPEAIAVVGYELEDGRVTRSKSYSWISELPRRLVDHWPDLAPAALLHAEFGPSVAAEQRRRSMLLQLSGDRAKLQFFSRAFGWCDDDGLGGLLGFLSGRFESDLRPLLVVRDVMVRHQMAMMLGLVAVGGGARRPALTFYFWP
jgi:hypothetical protein